ncbi:unnamed protein product, partial [marine sediment metagenome]
MSHFVENECDDDENMLGEDGDEMGLCSEDDNYDEDRDQDFFRSDRSFYRRIDNYKDDDEEEFESRSLGEVDEHDYERGKKDSLENEDDQEEESDQPEDQQTVEEDDQVDSIDFLHKLESTEIMATDLSAT